MSPADPPLTTRLRSAGAPALSAFGAAAVAAALDSGPLGLMLAAAAGASAPALIGALSPSRLEGALDGLGTNGNGATSAAEGDDDAPSAAETPIDEQGSLSRKADPASLIAPDLDRRALLPNQRPAAPADEDTDGANVLEALPAGLLLLDERGRVTFANRMAVEELGRAPVGMELTLLLRAPQLLEALSAAYRDGESKEVSFAVHGAQERMLFATLMPIQSEDRPLRMVVLLQDQTRIRRAEQLHRDFVANASHELKTPLAAIGGFIETLRTSAKDDPEARERFLGIMAQQTERMRLLIVDLMSLNRIELNEHVAPRDRISLNDIVGAAMTHVAEASEATRAATGMGAGPATVDVDLPEDSPIVFGDRSELTQALVNLIDNALKYGGSNQAPKVSIEIRSEERPRVALSVQDFGDGIAREHIPRLTERFYRVGADPAKGKTGTGLGLAIVKHVAARHRGELVIESRLGHGSRFTLLLPLAA